MLLREKLLLELLKFVRFMTCFMFLNKSVLQEPQMSWIAFQRLPTNSLSNAEYWVFITSEWSETLTTKSTNRFRFFGVVCRTGFIVSK